MTTDAERIAPITRDPVEHARSHADAIGDDVTDGARRATLASANAAAVRNAERLRAAAELLEAVEGDDASCHAEVLGHLRETRRTVDAAAEWYASYGEALKLIATERADGDA